MQPHWTLSAENLCRDVAGSDLEGHAVYIVDWSEVSAEFPKLHRPKSMAWTARALDLSLEPWLRRQDRWQGRGFAMIAHRDRIPSWRETLAACLHELAHWLDFNYVADQLAVSQPESRAEQELMVAALVDWCSAPDPVNRPPWLAHEATFVRAAAHLAHRAGEIIESIRPAHLRFSSPYFGVSENTWMATLQPELETSEPIRDVLKREPPEAFTELWAAVTDWWDDAEENSQG